MSKLWWILCCSLTGAAWAGPVTFDAASGILRIPQVESGSRTYSNVQLRLESDGRFSVIAIDVPVVPAPNSTLCTTQHINPGTLARLRHGMNLAEVDAIIACANDPSRFYRAAYQTLYTWREEAGGASITVSFDENGDNAWSILSSW